MEKLGLSCRGRDGDPRHHMACTGLRGRFSASTYMDVAHRAEERPLQPGYQRGSAWPRAPCSTSGLALSTMAQLRLYSGLLRPVPGHQAPSSTSGLAPDAIYQHQSRLQGPSPSPAVLGCPLARSCSAPLRTLWARPPSAASATRNACQRAPASRAPIGSHRHHSRGRGSPIGLGWEGRKG